jgi:hypothetical protein
MGEMGETGGKCWILVQPLSSLCEYRKMVEMVYCQFLTPPAQDCSRAEHTIPARKLVSDCSYLFPALIFAHLFFCAPAIFPACC